MGKDVFEGGECCTQDLKKVKKPQKNQAKTALKRQHLYIT